MKTMVVSILVGMMLVMSSCGGGSDPVKPVVPTAQQMAAEGWTAYTSNNYTLAIEKFNACIASYPSYADAYAGAGWASLRNNNITEAKTFFTTGNGLNPTGDALYMIRIGLASATLLDNSTPATIGTAIVNYLSAHVNIANTWVHPYDIRITAITLHNLLAEGYINRGSAYWGTESGSAVNALTAWGQIKKALEMSTSDAKAVELRDYLRGVSL